MFKWPNVSDIWSTYLTKFIARYGGRKLERARDLFEQALDGCPPKYAKSERGHVVLRGGVVSRAPPLTSPHPRLRPAAALYLLYAQLEEEWGLARHAMAVYERATRAVEPAQQYDMFNIYIKRAAEIYGVTHTRSIYQKAIEVPALGGGGRGAEEGLAGRESERACVCVADGRPTAQEPAWCAQSGVCTPTPIPASLTPPNPTRCCLMSMPGRCACGLLTWSASSGRSTAPGPYTASARRSATPG